MVLNWLFGNRRKKMLARPLEADQVDLIAKNVWHWQVLTDQEQSRLQGLVQIFLAEKNFEGCDGLIVTNEMKITIAASACIMLVGFADTWCFDNTKVILVYSRNMVQKNFHREDGLVQETTSLRGLASSNGTIVLSWQDVLGDSSNYHAAENVVIHEFAHHVDGIDGDMGGIPPLPARQLRKWKRVANQELANLRLAVSRGEQTVLDPYGAENLTEFFAVATEAFFCDPVNLHAFHPELYGLLELLYAQKPRDWFES